MTIEEKIFKCTVLNTNKLKPYGFHPVDDKYVIEKMFMNGTFKAIITTDRTGHVCGTVYDVDSDDIYMPLRIEEMAVGFAGKVRSAYIDILEDIKAHCFGNCYFAGAQANRIAQRIFEICGDVPVFPWDKYSGHGVFKNPCNGKWYALIMNIDKSKLDKAQAGAIDVINIKLDENEIPELLKRKGFYPAYHMNKKYWITLILDETLDDEEIMELIDESHNFTIKKCSSSK